MSSFEGFKDSYLLEDYLNFEKHGRANKRKIYGELFASSSFSRFNLYKYKLNANLRRVYISEIRLRSMIGYSKEIPLNLE